MCAFAACRAAIATYVRHVIALRRHGHSAIYAVVAANVFSGEVAGIICIAVTCIAVGVLAVSNRLMYQVHAMALPPD